MENVLSRHESFRDGSNVSNLDETCTSTVGNTPKIVSPKGVKQVHQVKGAERGISVTTCVIISAYGSVFPPVHIFPRKKFVPALMFNAFPGALGLANEKGYMTKETFKAVMGHFIKHSGASNPHLLFLDNVESHFSIETLDLAKANGVVIFTFPPHCTHRLQPLDIVFFGPFKANYASAVNSFLVSNPATVPTIYHIAGFVKDALSKTARPEIIIKAFEKAGIYPFSRTIFTAADFRMAKVTEKTLAEIEGNADPQNQTDKRSEAPQNFDLLQEEIEDEAESAASLINVPESDIHESEAANTPSQGNEPEITVNHEEPIPSSSASSFQKPSDIWGFPKAKNKPATRKPRRKGKCFVPTDTPEKNEIAERERA